MTIEDLRRREAEQEADDLRVIGQLLRSDRPEDAALHALQSSLSPDVVPPMLYDAWRSGELLSDDAIPRAIWGTWVYNKAPMRGLGERKWLQLFKAAGFVPIVVDEVRHTGADGMVTVVEHAFDLITEKRTRPMTVWRGAALRTAGRGMSWSVHRDCARLFAERVAATWQDAGVYEATISPRAVLAVFGDEREQEVVVNPNCLRGKAAPRLVETVPAEDLEIAIAEFVSRFRKPV